MARAPRNHSRPEDTKAYLRSAAAPKEPTSMTTIFRLISFAVLALMLIAILYAGTMGIVHWAGIGV
jgi:hypothetical protein